MRSFEAGDVIVALFPGVREAKPRPLVVLSSQTYHLTRPDDIVGILTTNLQACNTPSDDILLDWEEAGLRARCALRAFLASRPAQEVVHRAGRLSERDWEAVKRCVNAALGTG